MVGKFITFEGGEGSGKSTQIKLLGEYFKSIGRDVLLTKEPGGTDVGQELRKILITGDKDKFDYIAETLLYYADRRIHLQQKILPAVKAGKWVISDRYADSTKAYQYYGHGKKISLEQLDMIYKFVAGDFQPNLTIILDIDHKIGLARSFAKSENMVLQETRFESIGLDFHNRIRKGFLEMAKSEPNRFVVLDANKSVEDLHKNIVKVLQERVEI